MSVIEGLSYITIVLLWIFMYSMIRIKNVNYQLELRKLETYSKIDQTIPEHLDRVILEAFEEYMVLNEAYKKVDYINKEMETRILHGVSEYVDKRMSSLFYSKLTMYYNEEFISQIIANKIYILVMNNSIQNNQIRDEEEQ